MKRIQSACLCQTILFSCKDESLPKEESERALRAEVTAYKAQLDRSRIKYRIDTETMLDNGAVMLKIRKQYLSHSCGDYLN